MISRGPRVCLPLKRISVSFRLRDCQCCTACSARSHPSRRRAHGRSFCRQLGKHTNIYAVMLVMSRRQFGVCRSSDDVNRILGLFRPRRSSSKCYQSSLDLDRTLSCETRTEIIESAEKRCRSRRPISGEPSSSLRQLSSGRQSHR